MTKQQVLHIMNGLRRRELEETVKIDNKSGFWQPDQIEKWKIKRYTFIKEQIRIRYDYPEYFL